MKKAENVESSEESLNCDHSDTKHLSNEKEDHHHLRSTVIQIHRKKKKQCNLNGLSPMGFIQIRVVHPEGRKMTRKTNETIDDEEQNIRYCLYIFINFQTYQILDFFKIEII